MQDHGDRTATRGLCADRRSTADLTEYYWRSQLTVRALQGHSRGVDSGRQRQTEQEVDDIVP